MLENIVKKRVAVLGDMILDKYTRGETARISPEAPVPILKITGIDFKIGGAGNVLANLSSLGMDCIAFGRVGRDENGRRLKQIMKQIKGLKPFLISSSRLPTITKNRIIAQNQQLIRLDEEMPQDLKLDEELGIMKNLEKIIASVDAIVLSDYGKGFLTSSLVKKVNQLARRHRLPVVVDPKSDDFSKYRGATVITPNQKEAEGASRQKSVPAIAKDLIKQANLDFIMITRGKDGISYFKQDGRTIKELSFPVKVQEVIDVTGAGDTVVAVTAMCLANGLPHDVMCQLCNLAAGDVVGHLGAANISFAQLKRLAKDQDALK